MGVHCFWAGSEVGHHGDEGIVELSCSPQGGQETERDRKEPETRYIF
jgi:hypothetical protein